MSEARWRVAPRTSTRELHIVPVKDLQEHRLSRICWCEPAVKPENLAVLVVHNAADGRELVEKHGVQ